MTNSNSVLLHSPHQEGHLQTSRFFTDHTRSHDNSAHQYQPLVLHSTKPDADYLRALFFNLGLAR